MRCRCRAAFMQHLDVVLRICPSYIHVVLSSSSSPQVEPPSVLMLTLDIENCCSRLLWFNVYHQYLWKMKIHERRLSCHHLTAFLSPLLWFDLWEVNSEYGINMIDLWMIKSQDKHVEVLNLLRISEDHQDRVGFWRSFCPVNISFDVDIRLRKNDQ